MFIPPEIPTNTPRKSSVIPRRTTALLKAPIVIAIPRAKGHMMADMSAQVPPPRARPWTSTSVL